MGTVTESLDHRGRSITTFVVFEVATAMDRLDVGASVELITDAFAPFQADIEAWCRTTGHILRTFDPTPDSYRFVIEKGTAQPKSTSLAMVISNAGLEDLLSPLGFALGAALEGIEVNLYFQGPAVRVLEQGYRPKLSGWGRPFSRFAAAGMAKSGHIAAQDKLQQLRQLGAQIYVCGGSLQPFKVKSEDLIFDDLPIVEYLTFMEVMEGADIRLYI